MAQHDHINKRRPKKKEAPTKKPFPIFSAVIAAMMLILLGYGLYYISQNSASQPKPETKKTKPVAAQSEKQLPTEPDFIHKMKHDEVEVKVTKVKDKGPHRLQCASLRSEDDAHALKAQIAFKTGMIAEVDRSVGKNGIWYRVRIGPFDNKRDAESANNKIHRQRMQRCTVQAMPKPKTQ